MGGLRPLPADAIDALWPGHDNLTEDWSWEDRRFFDLNQIWQPVPPHAGQRLSPHQCNPPARGRWRPRGAFSLDLPEWYEILLHPDIYPSLLQESLKDFGSTPIRLALDSWPLLDWISGPLPEEHVFRLGPGSPGSGRPSRMGQQEVPGTSREARSGPPGIPARTALVPGNQRLHQDEG